MSSLTQNLFHFLSNSSGNATSSNFGEAQQLIQLLFSNYTGNVADCLSNCTNGNGLCQIQANTTNVLECSCLASYYYGSGCQYDLRPCSSSPCLNNGQCLNINDNLNKWSFNCSCQPGYVGSSCQDRVDMCANQTCSSNGVCRASLNSTATRCECYDMYFGEECEFESESKKVIKRVSYASTIIAIIFIIFYYLICVLIDLISYFGRGSKIKSFDPYGRNKRRLGNMFSGKQKNLSESKNVLRPQYVNHTPVVT